MSWSENAALFERLMEIHSNPPELYYGSNWEQPIIKMRMKLVLESSVQKPQSTKIQWDTAI